MRQQRKKKKKTSRTRCVGVAFPPTNCNTLTRPSQTSEITGKTQKQKTRQKQYFCAFTMKENLLGNISTKSS